MEWGNALVGLMMALIVLALMTDWPFGLVLLHRWAWPRYAVCTCMAGGFTLMGLAWIGAWTLYAARAWRHLTGPRSDGRRAARSLRASEAYMKIRR